MTTTLILNQVPRFPAHVRATNGLAAIVENGVDVLVVPSYGDLVPVPAVTKPATTYFMAWDAEIDYYQSISFDQLAENLSERVLGQTLTAQIDLVMAANQAIYFTSPTASAAYDLSAFVRGISGSADSASFRTAIGLGNVNNTSDANKPVSTAQQTALDLKASKSIQVNGAGLVTGGGDLASNRTLTVTKSSNAQAIAGVDDTTAMTPARVKDAISALAPDNVKAWVNFNGTGVVSVRASKNVSSVTDNGVGDYTINFTANLIDGDYAVGLAAPPTNGRQPFLYNGSFNSDQATMTASGFRVAYGAINSGTLTDVSYLTAIVTR